MLPATNASSDFTQQKSKTYSITGFVQNESDGTVWRYPLAVPELMLDRSEEKPKAKLRIWKD
jgi:hypothetical protein